MTDTQRRTLAGVGAAGGYLYDQHRQTEQAAYQRGVADGSARPR